MTAVRQTHFGAGELSQYLWGRTDSPLYGKGARRLRDFFVTKHGMAMSRPGSYIAGQAKFRFGVSGGQCRLIPWIISDTNGYALEFGDKYLRWYQAGAQASVATPGGMVTEIATPYDGTKVKDLQFSQVGDVMTLTHPDYDAMELRNDFTSGWVLQAINYNPIDGGLQGLWRDISASPGTYAATREPKLINSTATPIFTPDASHLGRPWTYRVTAVLQNTVTGALLESTPFKIRQYLEATTTCTLDPVTFTWKFGTAATTKNLTEGGLLVLAPDRPVTIRREVDPSWAPGAITGYRVLRYNYYRGEGSLASNDGIYGFIGSSTANDFVDAGQAPDYTLQPPLGTSPFVRRQVGAADLYDRPVAVTHFEQRRVFGGASGLIGAMPTRPTTLLFSGSGNFYDYDKHTLSVSGEALEFELASRKRESIRSLVGLRRLVVLTDSSAWSVGGWQGPLDFDTVQAQLEDEVGATNLHPIVLDGTVLYARSKGVGVRGLQYDGAQTTFQGSDLSWHAQHLFRGVVEGKLHWGAVGFARQVVDWAFAEDPWSLVWAVRDDGILLSLQYTKDGTPAWTRCQLAGGWVRAICTVPDGDEDKVYMVVERDAGTYIECLGWRTDIGTIAGIRAVCTDGTESMLVDAVDFTVVTNNTYQTVINSAHLKGRTDVWMTCDGSAPQGPLTVDGSGNVSITVPEGQPNYSIGGNDYYMMLFGLLYQPELELLDVVSTETRTKQKTVVSVGFEVDQSVGLWVGQDFEHLVEWRQRRVADSFSSVSAATDLVVVPVRGTYDRHARAVLRQTLPLPVTVVGVTREVDVGGD